MGKELQAEAKVKMAYPKWYPNKEIVYQTVWENVIIEGSHVTYINSRPGMTVRVDCHAGDLKESFARLVSWLEANGRNEVAHHMKKRTMKAYTFLIPYPPKLAELLTD